MWTLYALEDYMPSSMVELVYFATTKIYVASKAQETLASLLYISL